MISGHSGAESLFMIEISMILNLNFSVKENLYLKTAFRVNFSQGE